MADSVEIEGKVVAVLPGTMFRVEIANGHQVLAHISGKLRKNFIKLTVGDRVKMEMTPQDIEKARIVYRLKNNDAPKVIPLCCMLPALHVLYILFPLQE